MHLSPGVCWKSIHAPPRLCCDERQTNPKRRENEANTSNEPPLQLIRATHPMFAGHRASAQRAAHAPCTPAACMHYCYQAFLEPQGTTTRNAHNCGAKDGCIPSLMHACTVWDSSPAQKKCQEVVWSRACTLNFLLNIQYIYAPAIHARAIRSRWCDDPKVRHDCAEPGSESSMYRSTTDHHYSGTVHTAVQCIGKSELLNPEVQPRWPQPLG